MEYSVDYFEDKQIIQVVVKGRVNFKLTQQYSMEAIKLAREYNCKKYLVNHTKTLLEEKIYKIHTDGDALEQFGFKSTDKISVVISGKRDDLRFSETTDANVKWSNFKYFNSAKDALSWLDIDE